MTIAIGMLNREKPGLPVICVGADSQTTCGNVKRSDAEKVTKLEFQRSSQYALIAQAGNADNAERAIEIMEEISKTEIISERRSVADLAQRAIVRCKQEIREHQGNCSPEELRDFILNHEQNFQLLIANYFEGEPFLFVADLWTGAASRQNSFFSAIGTGANLAAYLIAEYCSPEMPLQSAYAAMIYIIDEVKKHDTYCSGETRVKFMRDESDCHFVPQNLIRAFSKTVAKFNPEAKKQRNKMVNKFLVQWAKSLGSE